MSKWPLKLLYDGACPFCRREVAWLQQRDKLHRLVLEDLADPAFDPARYGLTAEQVRAMLHGVLADGRVVRGMEAVRAAYAAVGLGWVVAATRLPGLRWATDHLYRLFARHRIGLGHLVGRRCTSDCPK